MVDGEGDYPLRGVQLHSGDMHGRRYLKGLQGLLAGRQLLHGRVLLLAGRSRVRLSHGRRPG